MPNEKDRLASPWLTVLRWEYDGARNNGMPDEESNRGMLVVDDALVTIERQKHCTVAYRRIGDGVREFVVYVADQEQFLASLNGALTGQPRFPMEITFYKDKDWSELKHLIDDFREA